MHQFSLHTQAKVANLLNDKTDTSHMKHNVSSCLKIEAMEIVFVASAAGPCINTCGKHDWMFMGEGLTAVMIRWPIVSVFFTGISSIRPTVKMHTVRSAAACRPR